jgi:nucleoside-diphosphate-sugar epimerase
VSRPAGGAAPVVFVTGGAGFLGVNLCRRLLDGGYRVVSFDRSEAEHPDRDRVRAVRGDVRDRRHLAEAMAGATHVVHAAAALPLHDPEDIYSTDVLGTRHVLEAARACGVERVVHISSTAVYGIPDHHPLLEDDRLHGVGPYGEAKILAEYEALKHRARGLCVPILRPKSFVGPERLGVFALLFEWAHGGRGFPMLGDGANRYQLLDVADLCDAICLCLEGEARAVDDVFNVGAREFATFREDLQAVLDAAGHGGRMRPLPAAPAVAALRALEALRLSPLYRWVYETAATDSYVSIERAERVLGYDPKYSNRDALLRNYRWYVENAPRLRASSGVDHRSHWRSGVLALAKHAF